MNIDFVGLLLRLLHIIPAIFLAGGIFFMWTSLLPAAGSVSDDAKANLLDGVRKRWSKVVMASSGLLLASGLYNFVMNAMAYDYAGGPLYHILGTIKLLLALGIMFLVARLSGKSESAAKFRERQAHWVMITTMLVFGVIVLASTMRTLDKTPKPPKVETPVAVLSDAR